MSIFAVPSSALPLREFRINTWVEVFGLTAGALPFPVMVIPTLWIIIGCAWLVRPMASSPGALDHRRTNKPVQQRKVGRPTGVASAYVSRPEHVILAVEVENSYSLQLFTFLAKNACHRRCHNGSQPGVLIAGWEARILG